jgi:hypothetical protein
VVSKRFCFDLDGTICKTEGLDYSASVPMESRIRHVNDLYRNGHYIIIFTARGTMSGQDHSVLTETQLKKWGLNFHELILGKPAADIYIDDKGQNSEEYGWLEH